MAIPCSDGMDVAVYLDYHLCGMLPCHAEDVKESGFRLVRMGEWRNRWIVCGFVFGVLFGVIMVFNICDLIGMYVAPESSTICYILKELR